MDYAQRELMAALATLHLGGKYSDLTVVCNSKQWAVHRAIVCSRSGFFDGACSGQFREANTGLIDLSEDDEEAIDHMIHYFYHLDYLPTFETEPASANFPHKQQMINARQPQLKKLDLSAIEDPLFALAAAHAPRSPDSPAATPPALQVDTATSYFDVASARSPAPALGKPRMRSISSPKSVSPMPGSDTDSDCDDDEEYETDESDLLVHTRVYALAEKYDIPALKLLAKHKFEIAMACFYDSPEFADAIEEVYCSTIDSDRGLRDVVLQAFRTHPQLASTQDVFSVIKGTPALAFELWKVERGIPV